MPIILGASAKTNRVQCRATPFIYDVTSDGETRNETETPPYLTAFTAVSQYVTRFHYPLCMIVRWVYSVEQGGRLYGRGRGTGRPKIVQGDHDADGLR